MQPLRPRSLPGDSGLSSLRRQQREEKSGEHPRVLISLPSRDPSKSFSIIKQARPKNSTEIYYMWQDNLRGEQGTKCPLCPNLPPDDLVAASRAQGWCWVSGARVWWWVAGMPSKAAGLGEALFPGRGSLAAFYIVVGFGRARHPQLGVPGCSEEGTLFGHPGVAWRLLLHPRHQQQAPQTYLKISRWHGRPPSPWFRCCRVWQPRNSIPRCGSLSLKYLLSQALAYLQSSPA